MKKQPITTARTKQNIIDAFWELYETKRIEKITIKDITLKAGYNRGTFYEYFVDVYDVLEHIENSLIVKLQELTPNDVPVGEPFPFEILISMFTEYRKYFIVLLGDNGNPSFLSKVKKSFKPQIKLKLTALGVKDDFELDYTLEYTLSALIGVLDYWFRQENPPELEQLMGLIHEISEMGVMTKIKKAGHE